MYEAWSNHIHEHSWSSITKLASKKVPLYPTALVRVNHCSFKYVHTVVFNSSGMRPVCTAKLRNSNAFRQLAVFHFYLSVRVFIGIRFAGDISKSVYCLWFKEHNDVRIHSFSTDFEVGWLEQPEWYVHKIELTYRPTCHSKWPKRCMCQCSSIIAKFTGNKHADWGSHIPDGETWTSNQATLCNFVLLRQF